MHPLAGLWAPQADAEYTTGEGMHRMARVSVRIPPGSITNLDSYILTVRMRFGATEIKVSARNAQTGEEVETAVRFAFEQTLHA